MTELLDFPWPIDTAVEEQCLKSTLPSKPYYSREQRWRGATEEGWRQVYKAAAQEAANCGRLTRLKEQCIVTCAVGPQERLTNDNDVGWKPKTALQIQDNQRTVALQIICEAARKGAATKLPEKVITTNGTSDDNDDDDGIVEEELNPQSRIEQAIQQMKQRQTRNQDAFLPHSNEPLLIPPLPPVIRHRRQSQQQAEIPIRPMVDLSALAALKALERRARLNRPSSHVRIRTQCSCQWCQTASPYQTHFLHEQSLLLLKQPHQPLFDAACVPSEMGTTKRRVPRLLRLVDIAQQHKRISVLTLPVELQGCSDEFDSSEYTEITVSSTEEDADAGIYPIVTIHHDDEEERSRTSDVTHERTTMLLVPVVATVDTTNELEIPTLTQTSATQSKSASNEWMDVVMPLKPPQSQPPPPPSCARQQRPPQPPKKMRPPPPNVEYVVVNENADVSMLSLPMYFDDVVEQAFLEQILTTNKTSAAPSARTNKPSCRIRQFLKRRFQTGPMNVSLPS